MQTTYINNLILRLCKQPRTFGFLAKNLSGFDPVALQERLKELERQNIIENVNGLWCIINKERKLKIDLSFNTKTQFFNEHIGFFGLFNKPHPLDFEWRNSTESLDYLINIVQEINDTTDSVLFLGFPTLFATSCIKRTTPKVTLVENNTSIVNQLEQMIPDNNRFKIINQDIFKIKPKDVGKYNSVFMDPPWYTRHFYQFMWLAAQCVELGGIVAISLPSLNIRPSFGKERLKWFSFCQKNGLGLENLRAQQLLYAMPFFEFNAFRAAGIRDILPFWRSGDLAFFRKVSMINTRRPTIKASESEWKEIEIKDIRIRIKKENSAVRNTELKIIHLIKGDILPTVSNRDERRKKANIWTSGNRIFHVNNTKVFIKLLEDYYKNRYKIKAYKMIADFIEVLSETENKEYNNYLEWLYHGMESRTN